MADSLVAALAKVVGPLTADGKASAKLATTLVPQTPRRRAAVVLRDGYATLDTYHAVRPKLFAGSIAVGLGAAGMAWYRRRQGTEAPLVWGSLAILGGLVAYLTRPAAGTGNAQATAGKPPTEAVYGWLDARAARLDQTDPGWEQRTMARALG